jgi:starch synthase
MFLMPSRYEPCGLSQLYSLRYGTIPIVHATGGLADTVVNCDSANLRKNKANGFNFFDYTPWALLNAVERAVEVYHHPKVWKKLQVTGMKQDWSWDRSAAEYAGLYGKMTER